MKTLSFCSAFCLAAMLPMTSSAVGDEISLETAPPVVVQTFPVAGATDVDPALTELKVTFSKQMQDGSWSWSTWGEDNFPETTGKPSYLSDGRTCVLPVKLQPGKFYATWLNSEKFRNFKDAQGRSAVPYLLTFSTTGTPNPTPERSGARNDTPADPDFDSAPLDESQRQILAWSNRQFRKFFDSRKFEGWSEQERTALETRSLDALKAPRNQEYYQAISTLGALRSAKAVQPLLEIAADPAEKDNRDRWMAIRALGLIGDPVAVPSLIHLVYHGNLNTRWWAQISLVRLTSTNFGKDWQAWGKWWNDRGAQPPFQEQMIPWYRTAELTPPKLNETLTESDRKFFANLK